MIEAIKEQVRQCLAGDQSGHGMEHINRVLNLSLRFAKSEKADQEIVALIALLHDVDDYKLVGAANAELFTNAKRILAPIDHHKKEQVLSAMKTIGYSKRLSGIIPSTLEGMIVADADMCDAMGTIGILRSDQYNLARGFLYHFFEEANVPEWIKYLDYYLKEEKSNLVKN